MSKIKIINKQFIVNKTDLSDSIKVGFIESYIKNLGFTPLRWAIVKVENNFIVVNAAVQVK